MAKISCMITHAFLLIIFTSQFLYGEGRPIRSLSRKKTKYVPSHSDRDIRKLSSQIYNSDHSETSPKKNTPQKKLAEIPPADIHKKNFPSLKPTQNSPSSHEFDSFGVNRVDSGAQSNCLGVKCSDNFIPTAPGHSSDAGHSYMTNTDQTPSKQNTNNPKVWNSLEGSEDGFRRTTPGHSPGAGHAEEDKEDPNLAAAGVPSTSSPTSFFSDSAQLSINDFPPTTPGGNPGAGHLDKNKMDVQKTGFCLSEKCKDDFRPTKPGDSPGAGHLHISDSDSIASKQSKHPGVVHPHAEGTDDYRPTKPGHSPGAGHAALEKHETNS
ncbi:precursor of CEP9-like [Chenopodium quinoa]|uniref:precursor of CEP9-like n=1 Tax=Chenopodium quinoa TaxID=63459 RepID=UPI000B77DE05|nr:precursor of CEP9-like [Chenopodium quinoa]